MSGADSPFRLKPVAKEAAQQSAAQQALEAARSVLTRAPYDLPKDLDFYKAQAGVGGASYQWMAPNQVLTCSSAPAVTNIQRQHVDEQQQ